MSESAILAGAATLREAGISDAQREARLLWRATFPQRYLDYEEIVSGGNEVPFFAMVARRAAREPMSHILGYRDFYAHRFYVSSDALDPRPDTEALVIAALAEPFVRVLDLGTGTGCVLLSLLSARPDATGLGTDVSESALEVARRNRASLELETRADLIQSDWFSGVGEEFDLIVSNPPYIAAAEMDDLQPEVRDHEPRIALTDEGDGLGAYRKIAAGVRAHLAPGGRLLLEIGPTQAAAVSDLLKAAGLVDIRVLPDLDGRDRVVAARAP